MKNNHFYTFIPDIAYFVPVKNLTEEEVLNLYQEISDRFTKGDLDFHTYSEFIVRKLIPKKVLTHISKKILKGEINESLGFAPLYDKIRTVYQILDVDNICNLLNDSIEIVESAGSSTSLLKGEAIMTRKELEAISKSIKSKVIGQDKAIESALDCIKVIGTGLETFTSLFFIGPTGVGKTEMSRALASSFVGDDRFLKINCGEYGSKHEYAKLIGSPPGYVGHDTEGILTTRAKESSKWVLLFDEIEKADEKLYDLLLNLLDEGTLMDNQGNVLDFTDSIFIFTSNVGLQDAVGKTMIGFNQEESTYDNSHDETHEEFKKNFKPEFINRLENIVYFNLLSKEDASKIVRLNLKGLPVKVTKPLVDAIVSESFSNEYGARNLKRYIKKNVTTKVADILLDEGVNDHLLIPVVTKGKLVTFTVQKSESGPQ